MKYVMLTEEKGKVRWIKGRKEMEKEKKVVEISFGTSISFGERSSPGCG